MQGFSMKIIYVSIAQLLLIGSLWANSGKEVFEKYCWGCHHQSAEAFGPSFTQIASTRDEPTIRAMIANPESVSRVLGYKRNAMPAFKLKEDELKSITSYILSFKENNQTKGTK